MTTRRDPSDVNALGEGDHRSVAATRKSYEKIPYVSSPWTSSQPARLETIAKLYGVDAAPADACRVLEIGCGDGGNLIPLAVAHPASHFVGVDLADVHIAAARAFAGQLTLDNLELAAASFVDWGHDAEPFDYVIAHGLMSWLTPKLQDLLLATFRRLLAPGGVVFVSYNTFPGWALQHTIREVLRHHCRSVDDIETSVDRAQTLLDVLIRTVPGKEAAYREHLESVGAVARNPARRHYFAHEYLEDENHPFFFGDFIVRARESGLAYAGDADLIDCELDNMPDEPRALLEGLADGHTSRGQLLDFAVNRKFRQSLLCRDDDTPLPAPDLMRIQDMYVSSALGCEDSADRVTDERPLCFTDRHGRSLELDQPVAKAALMRFIEESPQPISLPALVEWARKRSDRCPPPGSTEATDQLELITLVFGRLFVAGMASVQASPPCWAAAPGERPLATPLVRRAAALGDTAPSLRHTSVALDNDTVCAVLALLDGTRDRDALIRDLGERVEPGEIETILALAARNALLFA